MIQQQWLLYHDAPYAMLDEQDSQYDGTLALPQRVTGDPARFVKDLLETQQEHCGE